MKRLEYRGYERMISQLEKLLPDHLPWKKRAYTLLLLQGDKEIMELVIGEMGEGDSKRLKEQVARCREEEVRQRIYEKRSLFSLDIATKVTIQFFKERREERPLFDRLTTSPYTGFPLLFFILYIGLYYGVGILGAGKLVDLLEVQLFGEVLIPIISNVFIKYVPYGVVQDLFIGPYGLITLGLRYVFGIILPIVATFFLFFSLLEDTGYLPRVGLLFDRLFKVFGLGGQAVIPVILGFGCGTMGTLTTRILKSERERIIATFLLSFAIPCSAQLGLMTGILSQERLYLLLWGCVISLAFLISGRALTTLLPGSSSSFMVEVPLLRLPSLKNILKKTLSRIQWYLYEILPLFLYTSLFIWFFHLLGIFHTLLTPLKWVVLSMGLPEEMASVFFFGFFRRDYGAAGLYDLYQRGVIEGPSLLVAAVTLTLFVPCMAQMVVNIRERGMRVALLIILMIIPLAFLIGLLLHQILSLC